MFTIELLITSGTGRDSYAVVERIKSKAAQIGDANRVAISLLEKAYLRHPNNPPNAYRILNDKSKTVLRSWERSL